MAYRIVFSGLMVFLWHRPTRQVDVLLLNPCDEAGHDHHGAHGANAALPHDHAHHAADETCCGHRHLPQLMVKAGDLSEWTLPGALHGCGWHHFDLTGRVVFSNDLGERRITTNPPESGEYVADPFGRMRQVAYDQGMVKMASVLGNQDAGRVDRQKVVGLIGDNNQGLGEDLIAARVRLPMGNLTILTPLGGPARLGWQIGQQPLDVLGELVMFETYSRDNRIQLGDDFISLRGMADVPIWITNEPMSLSRSQAPDDAAHFDHYLKLLRPQVGLVARDIRPRPDPRQANNIDNPLCPPIEEEIDPPLP